MTPRQLASSVYNSADKTSENAIFKIVYRAAVLLGTGVGIPAIIWALHTADEMRTSLITMQSQMTVLQEVAATVYTSSQATKDWNFQAQRDAIQDADRQRIDRHVDAMQAMLDRDRG